MLYVMCDGLYDFNKQHQYAFKTNDRTKNRCFFVFKINKNLLKVRFLPFKHPFVRRESFMN